MLALAAARECGASEASGHSPPGPHASTAPNTWLWVWDRPQALTEPPAGIGIAYLHATVRLSGTRARWQLRQWPLRLPWGSISMPVVHVSLDNLTPAGVDEAQQQAIVRAVQHAAERSHSGWVQLDFEARPSQRAAYRAVLDALQPLRRGTPQQPAVRLSVTALASWCFADRWLPVDRVDEIVPMYFRMGRDTAEIRQQLQAHGQPPAPECRHAAGWLHGEAALPLRDRPRRYVFHPGRWRSADLSPWMP
jgi:hypothetical protein